MTLAMPDTEQTSRLVAAVEAARMRAARSVPRLTPATIYLTAADANAAGFRWQHFAKSDPPRCFGLPIRIILGGGKSRLYCRGGLTISLHGDLNPKPRRRAQ